MKAYVVLAGMTDYDVEGRITGTSDPSINSHGIEHVREAAKNLIGKNINMMLVAPHKRTVETAEIIAETIGFDKSKITKGLKLHERSFGDYEGKLNSDVDMFVLSSWYGNVATPNGETIRETANRVISYMNNMVKIFKTKTMLLVVPEQVFRVLYLFYNGLPEFGHEPIIDVSSCKIYEFETEDIPPEIINYQQINARSGDNPEDDPGRLLSQEEIDELIAEITKGSGNNS